MTAFRAETIGGITSALAAAAKACSELLSAGSSAVIEVREDYRKRTLEQNALIHALLTKFAEQLDIDGHYYPLIVWKRITVVQWLKDRGERPLVVPGIDGELLTIWERTSKLNTKQMAEYIEWLLAFAAQNGVTTDEQ